MTKLVCVMWPCVLCTPQAELLSRHILKFKEIVEDLESLPRFTPQAQAQPAY